jgi:hypothetical protein
MSPRGGSVFVPCLKAVIQAAAARGVDGEQLLLRTLAGSGKALIICHRRADRFR